MNINYNRVIKESIGKLDNGEILYQNKIESVSIPEEKLNLSLAKEIIEEKESFFESIMYSFEPSFTKETKEHICKESEQLAILYKFVKRITNAKDINRKKEKKNKSRDS